MKKLSAMRRMFGLMFSALASVVIFTGCEKDAPEPSGDRNPALKLKLIETQDNSVSFSIEFDDADRLAYLISDEAIADASAIFANGEVIASLEGTSVDRIISRLDANRSYTLYAAASAVNDVEQTVYSAVESLTFQTKELRDIITVTDMTNHSYKFVIDVEDGVSYKYTHLPKIFLEQLYEVSDDVTEEEKERGRMWYLSHYGIKASGRQEISVVDNESYIDYDGSEYVYEIYANTEYVIMVVFYDDSGEVFTEPVYMEEIKLPETGESTAQIACSVVGESTATEVWTLCEPDENILYYKQLVMLKEKYDEYISTNGLDAMKYMLGNDDRSTRCVGRSEDHWTGLTPDTEYIMCILGIDKDHNQLWIDDFTFRTVLPEEEGSIEMTGAVGDPAGYGDNWNSVNFTIKSKEIVTPSWYYFGQTSVVERLLARSMTYQEIAEQNGVAIIPIFVNQINSEAGWKVSKTEVRPNVSYTMFVALTHANGDVLVKRVDVTTESIPQPTRSESPLFTELLGEWSATCTADVAGEEVQLTFDVSITDGGEFVDQCRPYNRLMCLGFAGIEYRSPEDLRNDTTDDSYWQDVPEDIFYDFGPKWFLEIDPEGNVTLPTDNTVPYLMNYDINAIFAKFAVFGAYLTSKPCPVEVSDDRNTITVKPYFDEYMQQNFYLCMAEDVTATVVLKSDMVLTRK